MRRMEARYQRPMRVNNLRISNKALSILLAAGIALSAGVYGIAKVINNNKPNPSKIFTYTKEQKNNNLFDLDEIRKYDEERLIYLKKEDIKFDRLRYDILQQKVYFDGLTLSDKESSELYDQELLFVEHQKDLLLQDTSEFDPFRYMIYSNIKSEEKTDYQEQDLAKFTKYKEAYDYQRLNILKPTDFNISEYGVLYYKYLNKTMMPEDAVKLYDYRLIKEVHDRLRYNRIEDKNFGSSQIERSNDLMYKYVTDNISKEEYLELYDLQILRSRSEEIEKGKGR